MVNEIPGCSDCGLHEVTKWINSVADDLRFQIVTDDEIAKSVQQETDDDDDNGVEEEKEESESAPSHHETFTCLNTETKGYERKQKCEEFSC